MLENNIHTTKTQIGKTVYVVTSECSPTATETVEQKLERILLRRVNDVVADGENSRLISEKTLAM